MYQQIKPNASVILERSVISEAKAKVPTIDLAGLLVAKDGGRWRKVGSEWVARCPLPDHQDKSPSFTANPEKNLWYCRGCLRGGDVVELARYAWGYEKDEAQMAAADLLREFGHEVPGRPPSWYTKQERQAPVRAAIEETRKRVYRRRLFKYLILPRLEHIQDREEYARECRRAWEDFKELLP